MSTNPLHNRRKDDAANAKWATFTPERKMAATGKNSETEADCAYREMNHMAKHAATLDVQSIATHVEPEKPAAPLRYRVARRKEGEEFVEVPLEAIRKGELFTLQGGPLDHEDGRTVYEASEDVTLSPDGNHAINVVPKYRIPEERRDTEGIAQSGGDVGGGALGPRPTERKLGSI